MLPFGNRVAADTRTYSGSDYILPREFVDRYANEVKAQTPPKEPRHREIRTEDSDSDASDASDAEDTPPEDPTGAGDPTDGVQLDGRNDIDQCVKNWKAAASDDKKKSWAIFDETGVYLAACEHGLILWVCNMVRSGEL